MKYKTLVTGKNTTVIDDFFVQMDDNFEVVSTSTRFNDIMRHIKYFSPDIFVYCLNNETRESISQMVNIKSSLLQSRTPVIVIGSKEECDEFEKLAVNVAKLVLVRPFTAVTIQQDILKFMEERASYLGESVDSAVKEREETVLEKVSAIKDTVKEKIVEKVRENTETETEEPVPAVKAVLPRPASMSRTHILVVDDDPLMLKMLKQHLHDDYDVATAVSGKIAMKFLERKTTNLILLDYEMPGETGPEVLEKLRANEATKDIPVVFLTGVSEREKIQEALGLKPQGYLLKPIDHDKLMDTIKRVVR